MGKALILAIRTIKPQNEIYVKSWVKKIIKNFTLGGICDMYRQIQPSTMKLGQFEINFRNIMRESGSRMELANPANISQAED